MCSSPSEPARWITCPPRWWSGKSTTKRQTSGASGCLPGTALLKCHCFPQFELPRLFLQTAPIFCLMYFCAQNPQPKGRLQWVVFLFTNIEENQSNVTTGDLNDFFLDTPFSVIKEMTPERTTHSNRFRSTVCSRVSSSWLASRHLRPRSSK